MRKHRVLVTATILALMLFLSSFWLPPGAPCGHQGELCSSNRPSRTGDVAMSQGEESGLDSSLQHCPGQSFQSSVLLRHLKDSLRDEGDVLLGPYLQSWDQLALFMESLGTMVGFFSNKVKDKVTLIRRLSETPEVYRSVRSMVDWELDQGLVGFSFRTESGCRTLLRLHRSLLWVKLVLQGLTEDPDQHGVYKTPAEIGRVAYAEALAPHHSWFLRSAAELVFGALPNRKYFLKLVCVNSQSEAAPALRIIIRGLTLVHQRTQTILERNGLLLLP